jgi:hypothetical protein
MSTILKPRPLLRLLNRGFREECSHNIFHTVDESVVAFKDRRSANQFVPLKPIKHGFKGFATSYPVDKFSCL